ncbi:MAG: DUF362 domain-containing protein [Desulfomonile sp.]|nr:DUF362 domain-containing protein [Desulfomonile sp.]
MASSHNRREFIKTSLAAAAMVAGGSTALLGPRAAEAGTAPDLVICRGKAPAAMTRAAVDALGGMKQFVKPGNKVVIKPNMSFARDPGSGSNTRPEVVAELARMCVEAGASRVSVLDNVLQNPHDCLSMSRIPELCKSVPNTTVSNLQAKRFYREVKVDHGKQVKTMAVLTDVLEADVLIAAPVGKCHSSSGVSLSMKGMMGLIHDRMVFHSRHNLHEAIVDMVTVLKPHLVVIDGTRILTTGGPAGPGKVLPLDLVIASTDMVAADAQMVALGTWYDKKFTPDQVRHIRIAAERGLGRIDLDRLKVSNITA